MPESIAGASTVPEADYNPEDHAWIADVTLEYDGEECTPEAAATKKYDGLAEAWDDTTPETIT